MNRTEKFLIKTFGLDGKKIFITGVSSGIGKELSYALSQSGAEIIGSYNAQYPDCLEKKILESGGKISIFKLDLTSDNVIDEINLVFEKQGIPDILINCAGVNLRNWFQDYSIRDWEDTLDINLTSPFKLSQFFAQKLINNEMPGKIINIASLLSFQGGKRCLGYTVSKHGIVGMTKLMANELGQYGITVNCIAPGYIETKMTRAFLENTDISDRFKERIPLNRWGIPKDLVGAAILLCSSSADYMNGSTIVIDGGYLNN